MSRRKIYVTEPDLRRLCHVVATEFALDAVPIRHLAELIAELQRAQIVASDEVPDDVVTMNSTVVLRDLDTGEVETYTLVYPTTRTSPAPAFGLGSRRNGDPGLPRRRRRALARSPTVSASCGSRRCSFNRSVWGLSNL